MNDPKPDEPPEGYDIFTPAEMEDWDETIRRRKVCNLLTLPRRE